MAISKYRDFIRDTIEIKEQVIIEKLDKIRTKSQEDA